MRLLNVKTLTAHSSLFTVVSVLHPVSGRTAFYFAKSAGGGKEGKVFAERGCPMIHHLEVAALPLIKA